MKPALILSSLAAFIKRRRKLIVRVVLAGLVLTASVLIAIPLISVEIGTRRAIECLARYHAPHAPSEKPSCGDHMQWFVRPSRISWTRHNATYRAEEFYARMAWFDYLDAAVAQPNREALAKAEKRLKEVEEIVHKGSQRHSMEDLGREAIGAPNVGRGALLVGDQTTLLANPEGFSDWHVRLRALQGALSQGDEARALEVAKRFAVWDPAHEELRAATAAVLCMGDGQKRGIELLRTMQDDRASRRYAAIARNWGDVRTLLVACAARAHVPPPPRPESPNAGEADHVETRAVLRLKLIRASHREGAALTVLPAEREEQAVQWAAGLLSTGAVQNGTRAVLLAAVLVSSPNVSAADAIDMATVHPENGEQPLLSLTELRALDWLHTRPGLGPRLPAADFAVAAERLQHLARDDKLGAEAAHTLGTAADALLFEAIRAHALAGHKEEALALLRQDAAHKALHNEAALGFARSSVLYLSGDHREALAELEGALAHVPEGDPQALFQRASALLQRAELLAALRASGDVSARASRALAEASLLADEAAHKSGSPLLNARAQWMRLALARPPNGEPLRASSRVDLTRAEPSLRWTWTGAVPPWAPGILPAELQPLAGEAPPIAPNESSWLEPWRGALSKRLSHWESAVSAPPEQRLVERFRLLAQRGDAMHEPLAELSLAAELLGKDGDPELWLSVYLARYFGCFSHREHAFLRWHAAKWRGDDTSAARWKEIYEKLVALAFSDPSKAELAAFLDL